MTFWGGESKACRVLILFSIYFRKDYPWQILIQKPSRWKPPVPIRWILNRTSSNSVYSFPMVSPIRFSRTPFAASPLSSVSVHWIVYYPRIRLIFSDRRLIQEHFSIESETPAMPQVRRSPSVEERAIKWNVWSINWSKRAAILASGCEISAWKRNSLKRFWTKHWNLWRVRNWSKRSNQCMPARKRSETELNIIPRLSPS